MIQIQINNKSVSILILIIISISTLQQGQVQGQQIKGNTNENEYAYDVYYHPVIEYVSLYQDGNLTNPYIVNFTKTFDVISRIIWTMDFATNLVNYDNFGDDNALTNGINVMYAGISLLDNYNITANHEFAHTSYDLTILTDDNNPKSHILLSRWSFSKFIGCECGGLRINSQNELQIYVQDNISDLSSITELIVYAEGFQTQIIYNEAEQEPVWDPLTALGAILDESGNYLFLLVLTIIGILLLWRFRRLGKKF